MSRIYKVRLKNGRGCTVLDMEGTPVADAIKSIETVFGVSSIESITNEKGENLQ